MATGIEPPTKSGCRGQVIHDSVIGNDDVIQRVQTDFIGRQKRLPQPSDIIAQSQFSPAGFDQIRNLIRPCIRAAGWLADDRSILRMVCHHQGSVTQQSFPFAPDKNLIGRRTIDDERMQIEASPLDRITLRDQNGVVNPEN